MWDSKSKVSSKDQTEKTQERVKAVAGLESSTTFRIFSQKVGLRLENYFL